MNARTGLYDPAYEHDACGVAFVARLDARAVARDGRARADRASRTSSTAAPPGADARTGDGAGILVQIPDAFFRGVRRRRSCRRPAATASRCASCRTTTRAGAELEQLLADTAAEEGQRVVGWRDVPVDAAPRGRHRERVGAAHPPALRRGGRRARDQDAFERKLYVIRRRAELAAGPDLVDPELLVEDRRLQGDAHRAAAAGLLPRPARRAVLRARSRSSTRATRPTRSRAGSSPTRTA